MLLKNTTMYVKKMYMHYRNARLCYYIETGQVYSGLLLINLWRRECLAAISLSNIE
jgi:hypothetical protein